MEIKALEEFEGLIGKVESEVEKALKEREELGLSVPEDFEVYVGFYTAQYAKARSEYLNPGGRITLNVLPTVMESFTGRNEKRYVKEIMMYFDVVRDFMSNPSEEEIFSLIENPQEELERYEKGFGPENFREYKEFLKERGTDYDSYRNFIIENAQAVKKMLGDLMPEIERELLLKNGFSSLRHEMDHLALFSSPIFLDWYNKVLRTNQLGRKFHSLEEGAISKSYFSGEYAKAKTEALQSALEIIPLLETRAGFFDFVEPGEWGSVDLDGVKRLVEGRFSRDYVENSLMEEVLDTLVAREWAQGKMDRQTSNYLFQIVNAQRGSVNAGRYKVKLEDVNYNVANRILYEELPKWKRKFAKRAQEAAEAIATALKEDPTRLGRANTAKTFEEYLRMCRGGGKRKKGRRNSNK